LVRGETAEADADIARGFEIDPDPEYRVFGGGFLIPKYLGVPAAAKSFPMTAKITGNAGADASVFIYTRGSARPVRFDGAEWTKEVPINGPVLLVVAVPPSVEWQVGTTTAPSEPPGTK